MAAKHTRQRTPTLLSQLGEPRQLPAPPALPSVLATCSCRPALGVTSSGSSLLSSATAASSAAAAAVTPVTAATPVHNMPRFLAGTAVRRAWVLPPVAPPPAKPLSAGPADLNARGAQVPRQGAAPLARCPCPASPVRYAAYPPPTASAGIRRARPAAAVFRVWRRGGGQLHDSRQVTTGPPGLGGPADSGRIKIRCGWDPYSPGNCLA